MPDICLLSCQPRAMDPGLLSCSHADGLAVRCKADRVGLGIFQGDESNEQISLCLLGNVLVLRYHILQKGFIDLEIVPSLFKGDAEYLLALDLLRHIGRIHLDDIVGALLFLHQDLEGLLRISGSDHTVGYLSFQDPCGGLVADIGKGNEIAEGAHAVRSSCPGIGAGKG